MGRFKRLETPEEQYQRQQASTKAAAARTEARTLRQQAARDVSQMTTARFTHRDFPVAKIEAAPNADALSRSAKRRLKAAEQHEAEAARLEAQANAKPKRRWF
ncbi:MAG: hypothetical protein ACRDQ0_00050 [Pseudonocardia sp.]